MTDLAELLWRKAEPVLFITREAYLEQLADWTIEPVEIDGDVAFVFLIKGPELHYDSFGTGHRIPLKLFADRIWKVVDQHGYLVTRTPKDDIRQQNINRRFGCVVTHEDEFDIHFRLERRAPCLQ